MYQLELAQSGKRLFKIRGNYLVTIIIIGSVIAYLNRNTGPFDTANANQAWFWMSLVVAALGALIRIITSGYAALGTSGNIKDQAVAAELNTTGPYSLVRNPLYVGRILNFTGIAMLSGSWVFGVMTFLISVLIRSPSSLLVLTSETLNVFIRSLPSSFVDIVTKSPGLIFRFFAN